MMVPRRIAVALTFALVACDGTPASTIDAGLRDAAVDAAPVDAGPADAGAFTGEPRVLLPELGLTDDALAILIHEEDPQSVALGEAYAEARGIPEARVLRLSFESSGAVLSAEAFEPLREQVYDALGLDVQALAITWTQPYRVDCMSITSAFTLGFDTRWCSVGGGCRTTAPSPLFNQDTLTPVQTFGVRPSMMLAAESVEEGEALIARGVASDDTLPEGSGWLWRTTDAARSVRFPEFEGFARSWDDARSGVDFTYVDNSAGDGDNVLRDTDDVLFYFTGLARVGAIDTNTYLPGAMADHLTSFGGRVPTSGQMSVREWIAAGVTGTYGTVVEPCNFPDKFPRVSIAISRYVAGATLIEAYWASVRTPGEGLFVGEPMARPWRAQETSWEGGTLTITSNGPLSGETWVIESAAAEEGPWRSELQERVAGFGRRTFTLEDAFAPYYRLRRL
jgi:uncharacterized protein (TIGR03790 family)